MERITTVSEATRKLTASFGAMATVLQALPDLRVVLSATPLDKGSVAVQSAALEAIAEKVEECSFELRLQVARAEAASKHLVSACADAETRAAAAHAEAEALRGVAQDRDRMGALLAARAQAEASDAQRRHSCGCVGCGTALPSLPQAVPRNDHPLPGPQGGSEGCIHKQTLASHVIDNTFDAYRRMLREKLVVAEAELERLRASSGVGPLEAELREEKHRASKAEHALAQATRRADDAERSAKEARDRLLARFTAGTSPAPAPAVELRGRPSPGATPTPPLLAPDSRLRAVPQGGIHPDSVRRLSGVATGGLSLDLRELQMHSSLALTFFDALVDAEHDAVQRKLELALHHMTLSLRAAIDQQKAAAQPVPPRGPTPPAVAPSTPRGRQPARTARGPGSRSGRRSSAAPVDTSGPSGVFQKPLHPRPTPRGSVADAHM